MKENINSKKDMNKTLSSNKKSLNKSNSFAESYKKLLLNNFSV